MPGRRAVNDPAPVVWSGAIVLDGARKGCGDGRSRQQVIESVSLGLPPGRLTAVAGPPGFGDER